MLQDYLSKYSTFTIHTFNSGEECIKNLSLKPDIIFLDYNFDKVGKDAERYRDPASEIKSANPSTEVDVQRSGPHRSSRQFHEVWRVRLHRQE